MPPGKRITAPQKASPPARLAAGRRVTRTITVHPSNAGIRALAQRQDPPLTPAQVAATFEVERIAGPRDTNARWRFNIPGQMLVVAENDLEIIQDLIWAIKEEQSAKESGALLVAVMDSARAAVAAERKAL